MVSRNYKNSCSIVTAALLALMAALPIATPAFAGDCLGCGTSGASYIMSGNVGIGTTVPYSSLHVSNSSNWNYSTVTLGAEPSAGYYSQVVQNANYLDITANGDQSYRTALGTNNGTGIIRFFTAGFTTGNTERMRIDWAGNVGIGTTGPNGRLSIGNNVSAGGPAGAYGSYQIILWDPGNAANSAYGIGIENSTMWFNSGGSNYKFYNAGTIAATINSAGTYTAVSDRRLKTGIAPLEDAMGLSAIMKLKPVSFRWRDTARKDQGEQIGFIAQDVETVMPQVVTDIAGTTTISLPTGKTETIPDAKGVAYSQLVVPLVKAVQELKADNDNLRAANDNLRKRVEALEAKQP